MAKVGEGDSRWIVSERKDGTNCNAWHWEEKDLSAFTKEGLSAAFKDLPLVDDDQMTLKVKEVSQIKAEVTVAQRKGRILCYFDVKATLKYTGSVAEDEYLSCDGKIELPEVDHDSFRGDFEVSVRTTEINSVGAKAEAWIKKEGRPVIRQVVSDFFEELFAANNVGKNVKALEAEKQQQEQEGDA